MADEIIHEFDEPLLGQHFTVAVPRNCKVSAEFIWLQYVGRRLATPSLAWVRHSQIFPNRGRFFESTDFGVFELAWRKERESTEPDYGQLTVYEYTVEELQQRQQRERRADVRHGAKQVANGLKTTFDEVFPALDSTAFKSQRGQNALRLAMQSPAPVPAPAPAPAAAPAAAAAAEAPAGEREEKQKRTRRSKRVLFDNVKLPTPPSIPAQRARRADDLRQRSDVRYLIRDEHDRVVDVGSCPQDAAQLVGLVFDLRQQFKRALDLDAKAGELVEGAAIDARGPNEIELECVLDEDGATPCKRSVFAVIVRVLDRNKLVWRSGHSRVLRLLLAFLPESGVRDVAAIRNRVLSDFVHHRFVARCCRLLLILFWFCCSVTVRDMLVGFCLRWLAMDHKAKLIELALLAGDNPYRCGQCACPASEWMDFDMLFSYSERSVLDLAVLYLHSLIDTLSFMRDARERPTVQELIAHKNERCAQHGVHRWPALVVANKTALVALLQATARRLGIPELALANREQQQTVEATFRDVLLIDAQIHRTAPISDTAGEGFPLDCVRPTVSALHCNKGRPPH